MNITTGRQVARRWGRGLGVQAEVVHVVRDGEWPESPAPRVAGARLIAGLGDGYLGVLDSDWPLL